MTGLRVPAGDSAALAAALVRLFSIGEARAPRSARAAAPGSRAISMPPAVAEPTLASMPRSPRAGRLTDCATMRPEPRVPARSPLT